jgi:hypothetical protein
MTDENVTLDPAIDDRLIYEHRVAVGVDLGHSYDPTSIAVVEQTRLALAPHVAMNQVPQLLEAVRKVRPKYTLRGLTQAPLGESYVAQADRIKRVLSRLSHFANRPPVWVDYTGVGLAVFEIFRQAGVPGIHPTTITFNGQAGPNKNGGHSIPKIELISRINALMHSGRLHMPEDGDHPFARILRKELMEFRMGYTAAGNAVFGARESAHDDLVLALALAIYGLDSSREAIVEPLRI